MCPTLNPAPALIRVIKNSSFTSKFNAHAFQKAFHGSMTESQVLKTLLSFHWIFMPAKFPLISVSFSRMRIDGLGEKSCFQPAKGSRISEYSAVLGFYCYSQQSVPGDLQRPAEPSRNAPFSSITLSLSRGGGHKIGIFMLSIAPSQLTA